MPKLQISIASVKVMRSYDYCHFEVALSADVECAPGSAEWFDQVDNLRKNAARLADKSVEQYKIARRAAEVWDNRLTTLRYNAVDAEKTPESERTPEQKAALKALADANYAKRYDYEDDYDLDEE